MPRRPTAPGLLAAAVLAPLCASCGQVAVPVEVVTTYTISADAVIEDMRRGMGGADVAVPAVWPSPPYPQFVKDVAFTVSSDVDLRNQDQVAGMEGRIREIRLDHVDYTLVENTFNKAVSSLELRIGPKGGPADVPVARIAGIGAGERAAGRAALDPDGRLEAIQYLGILEFACGAAVTVPVDTTIDPVRPAGAATLRVTIGLLVIADPV